MTSRTQLFKYSVTPEYLDGHTEALDKQFKSFYETLPKRVQSAIVFYKSDTGYSEINNHLRNSGNVSMTLGHFLEFYKNHRIRKSANKRTRKALHLPASGGSNIETVSADETLIKAIMRAFQHQIRRIHYLDSALDAASIAIPGGIPASIPVLFRGIPPKPEKYGSWNIGEEKTFPTYLSTTLSPDIALRFQIRKNSNATCCIFVLMIPPAHRADLKWLYMRESIDRRNRRESSDKDHFEYEILLPRNTRWKLTRKYQAYMSPEYKKKGHALTIFECTYVGCEFKEVEWNGAENMSVEIQVKKVELT